MTNFGLLSEDWLKLFQFKNISKFMVLNFNLQQYIPKWLDKIRGSQRKLFVYVPCWKEYHVDSIPAGNSYIPEGHQTSPCICRSRLKLLVT